MLCVETYIAVVLKINVPGTRKDPISINGFFMQEEPLIYMYNPIQQNLRANTESTAYS